MNKNQFKEETKLFKEKFKNIKTSIIISHADGELNTAAEGNPLYIIKTLVELSMNDPYYMSIFLSVGEFLRYTLSSEQINGLTRLSLKKALENKNN